MCSGDLGGYTSNETGNTSFGEFTMASRHRRINRGGFRNRQQFSEHP